MRQPNRQAKETFYFCLEFLGGNSFRWIDHVYLFFVCFFVFVWDRHGVGGHGLTFFFFRVCKGA